MSILQKDFSYMPDAALQQAMMAAQRNSNTPEFLMLMSEANKRKQMRTAAQGQQAGAQAAQQPTTVADQVASGIANLPSGEHNYAEGGIVAFAGGGVPMASFGEFLRAQGLSPASFGDLSAQAQESLRSMFSNATQGPGKMAGAAVPGAGAAPAAQAVNAAETAAKPTGLLRTAFTTPQGIVGLGGAALSAGAANALSNATPEQLEALTGSGGGDDTALAAAIMAEGKKTPKREKPQAAKPTEPAQWTPQEQPQPPFGIASLTTSQRGGVRVPATPAAPTPNTKIEVDATDTPETLAKKRAALSAEDNEGLSSIYKRFKERDAAKQALLDAETKGEGTFLGAKDTPALREALLQAGIAMLKSKSPRALAGIGEGLEAGATAYKAGEEHRSKRQDLLDAADEKRTLAEYEGKQGNQDRAGKLMAQADALSAQAHARGVTKAQLSQQDSALAEQIRAHNMNNRLGYAQLENAKAIADARIGHLGGIGGLANMDLKWLKAQQDNINAQLKQTYPGAPEYDALRAQLAAVGSAIANHGSAGKMPTTSQIPADGFGQMSVK